MLKDFVKRWMLPPGVSDLIYQSVISGGAETKKSPEAPEKSVHSPQMQSLLGRNEALKGRHMDERCFILCNGPSVNKQNLLPLKDEVVFSVSSGYLHKDYAAIRPRYHCTPHITYTKLKTKEVTIESFREMDEKTLDTELFFSLNEEPLIRTNNLFKDKMVYYLDTTNNSLEEGTEIPDITKTIYQIQSVPIMCIQIAMYMGFKTIYLLGCEHDSIITNKYTYSFEPTILKDKSTVVDSDGTKNFPYHLRIKSLHRLFHNYEIVHKVADANDINIYNATADGILDEFERVDYNSINFGSKQEISDKKL